jgi:hypothetical protein
MASEPLRNMPAELVLGDSIRLRVAASAEYPLADWSPELVLVGPTSLSLSLEVEADGWLFKLPPDADDLAVGRYGWSLRMLANDETERQTIASGQIQVLPNPSEAEPPIEQRSFARRALETIEAAILRHGTAVLSFSVFGRTYTYESHTELLSVRNRLRAEVAAEDESARLERGEPSRQVAWVRFTRP